MELKNLRDWIFELIAILLPGGFAFILVSVFIINPIDFIVNNPNWKHLDEVILPFTSQTLNIFFLISVSFVTGHLIQQISNYPVGAYLRVFRIKKKNFIAQVFALNEVRQYLIPPSSGFPVNELDLKEEDFFMMVYPDVAPHTKRDTFVTIANFCGGMATVSILLAVFVAYSGFANVGRPTSIPVVRVILVEILVCVASYLLLKRSVSFQELADCIVVNYFLNKYGAYFRNLKATPAEEVEVSFE